MGFTKTSSEFYDLIYQWVDYETEVKTLTKLLAEHCMAKPTNILDIACGTGNHALILSQRGYDVTGLDLSEEMINVAKRKTAKANLDIDFVVQDMRNIHLDRKYDCAICMFTAFPYLLTYDDIKKALTSVKKHLVKGGVFLFDFVNISGLKPMPYKSWTKVQDQRGTFYRLHENRFDPKTSVLEFPFQYILIAPDGSTETFEEVHRLRCMSYPEIQRYLGMNGFELLAAYSWDGDKSSLKAFQQNTFRIIVVAKST
jgi:ubiquinone/menaquinone biosynthesis C-methylase UbiE